MQTPSAPLGALAGGMLDSAVPDRDSVGCLKGYARAELVEGFVSDRGRRAGLLNLPTAEGNLISGSARGIAGCH